MRLQPWHCTRRARNNVYIIEARRARPFWHHPRRCRHLHENKWVPTHCDYYRAAYLLSDEGSDEERGDAVGADDEAVDGGRAAGLLGDAGEERREEADGERRGQRRHHEDGEDQQLAGRDLGLIAARGFNRRLLLLLLLLLLLAFFASKAGVWLSIRRQETRLFVHDGGLINIILRHHDKKSPATINAPTGHKSSSSTQMSGIKPKKACISRAPKTEISHSGRRNVMEEERENDKYFENPYHDHHHQQKIRHPF